MKPHPPPSIKHQSTVVTELYSRLLIAWDLQDDTFCKKLKNEVGRLWFTYPTNV